MLKPYAATIAEENHNMPLEESGRGCQDLYYMSAAGKPSEPEMLTNGRERLPRGRACTISMPPPAGPCRRAAAPRADFSSRDVCRELPWIFAADGGIE
jgi:hypothetical protein